MDLDSPDVEKEFPGLYASEGVDGSKSKKSKEESDCKYTRIYEKLFASRYNHGIINKINKLII